MKRLLLLAFTLVAFQSPSSPLRFPAPYEQVTVTYHTASGLIYVPVAVVWVDTPDASYEVGYRTASGVSFDTVNSSDVCRDAVCRYLIEISPVATHVGIRAQGVNYEHPIYPFEAIMGDG